MTNATVVAAYPTSIVSTTELPFAGNDGGSSLTADVTSTALSLPVQDITDYTVPCIIRLGTERVLVTSKTSVPVVGNPLAGTLNVAQLSHRGWDSSTAASHKSGTVARLSYVAYLHNRVQAEIIAIETRLGTTATSGTVGSVIFVGATGNFAQDNANLFWDDTANELQVANLDVDTGVLQVGGTTLFENDRDLAVSLIPNADATLDVGSAARRFQTAYLSGNVIGSGSLHRLGPAASSVSAALKFENAGVYRDAQAGFAISSIADFSILAFLGARGSHAAKTAIMSGDQLGEMRFDGYVGATNQYVLAADINVVTTGAIADTTTGIGASMTFRTRASGSALATNLTLNSGGGVDVTTGAFSVGGTTLFENDRDLAVSLVPNATRSLNIGSSTHHFNEVFFTLIGDVVNVEAYGAVADGTAGTPAAGTDNLSAINSAIAALPASGGVLWFPSTGVYRVDGAVALPSSKLVRVLGAGQPRADADDGTLIYFSHTTGTHGFTATSAGKKTIEFENIGIYGSATVGSGVYVENALDGHLKFLHFTAHSFSGAGAAGVYLNNSTGGWTSSNNLFEKCIIRNNNYGVHLTDATSQTDFVSCTIFANDAYNVAHTGTIVSGAFNFIGGDYSAYSPDDCTPILLENVSAFYISGIFIEHTTAARNSHLIEVRRNGGTDPGQGVIQGCSLGGGDQTSGTGNIISLANQTAVVIQGNRAGCGSVKKWLKLRSCVGYEIGINHVVGTGLTGIDIDSTNTLGWVTDPATGYRGFGRGGSSNGTPTSPIHLASWDTTAPGNIAWENTSGSWVIGMVAGAAGTWRIRENTAGVDLLIGEDSGTITVYNDIAFGGGASGFTATRLFTGANDRLDLNGGDSFNIVLGELLFGGTALVASDGTFPNGLTLARSTAVTDGALIDSPALTLRAKYDSDPGVGTTSADYDATLLHNITAGGAAPASQIDVSIGGNVVASFYSTGQLDTDGPFSISGTVLFEADRDLAVALIPNADATLDVGSASRRVNAIYTTDVDIYAAAGAANPVVRLNTSGLQAGAGGASVLDSLIKRSGAAAWQFRDAADTAYASIDVLSLHIGGVTVFESDRDLAVNLIPNADATLDVGSAIRRVNAVYTTDIDIHAAAGAANPVYRLNTSGLQAGAGGASVLDSLIKRSGAAAWQFRDAADTAYASIDVLSLHIGGVTVFESDRDLAVSLLPNADNTLALGSSTRKFSSLFLGATAPTAANTGQVGYANGGLQVADGTVLKTLLQIDANVATETTLTDNTNRTPSATRPVHVTIIADVDTMAAGTQYVYTVTVGATTYTGAVVQRNFDAVSARRKTDIIWVGIVPPNTAYKVDADITTNLTLLAKETLL